MDIAESQAQCYLVLTKDPHKVLALWNLKGFYVLPRQYLNWALLSLKAILSEITDILSTEHFKTHFQVSKSLYDPFLHLMHSFSVYPMHQLSHSEWQAIYHQYVFSYTSKFMKINHNRSLFRTITQRGNSNWKYFAGKSRKKAARQKWGGVNSHELKGQKYHQSKFKEDFAF